MILLRSQVSRPGIRTHTHIHPSSSLPPFPDTPSVPFLTGLGPSDRLVFFAHSPDALRDLRVPQSILVHMPQLRVVTSLLDMQVYVFRCATVWVFLVGGYRM